MNFEVTSLKLYAIDRNTHAPQTQCHNSGKNLIQSAPLFFCKLSQLPFQLHPSLFFARSPRILPVKRPFSQNLIGNFDTLLPTPSCLVFGVPCIVEAVFHCRNLFQILCTQRLKTAILNSRSHFAEWSFCFLFHIFANF